MEWKYLPDDAQRRINLWRRGIFLFHKTSEEEGPFYQAGYSDYWCEGYTDDGLTPDIFGFSQDFFCICDLSSSKSKRDVMKKYKDCRPRDYIKRVLSIEGDRSPAGYPFLITDQFGLNKYPGYNLIQVETPINVEIEMINDRILEKILEKWQGFRTVEPSFQLLAVPESSPEELKKPLAGILKWASVKSEWISYDSIVHNLLGCLDKSFSDKSKAQLREKVRRIVTDLSRSHLKNYLEMSDDKIMIRMDISNHQVRKGFSDKINEWLDIRPIEVFFEDEESDEL